MGSELQFLRSLNESLYGEGGTVVSVLTGSGRHPNC
jgi:hypothetical protein